MAEHGRLILQWVERLLEPSTDEGTMTGAAQVLSQSHYVDVVEERTISDLCGYPPCSNALGEQPKQKYHISLAQKKVYDLTERKKFCSAECYRASRYYASQLSSLLHAARDGKSITIRLMPPVGGNRDEPTASSESGNAASGVSGLSSSVTPAAVSSGVSGLSSSVTPAAVSKDGSVIGSITEKNYKEVVRENPPLSEATNKVGSLSLLEDAEDLTNKVSQTPPKLSPVSRLLHAMSSWCTPSTWKLLARFQSAGSGGGGGENVTREKCSEETGVEHVDKKEEQGEVVVGKNQGGASASGGEGERVEGVEGVNVEGMKVEEERVEGVRMERERVEEERVKGVRVEGMKVEGERVEGVRVEGVRVEGMKVEEERVEGGRGRVEGGEGGGESLFLPPVHSSAQSQLQMSIFLQQLKRNLPSVATQLHVDAHELLSMITPLVRTFSFSRHTVTFKPVEWKVIIFILLQIVHPEWDVWTLHSAVIQEWRGGVCATDNDIVLMLNTFKPPAE